MRGLRWRYFSYNATSLDEISPFEVQFGFQFTFGKHHPHCSRDTYLTMIMAPCFYGATLMKYMCLILQPQVAKEELSRECDYELEAQNQKRFGILLFGTKGFYVPVVIDDLSSKRVLTSELVPGIPIDKVALLDQETRNYVGRKLLELTLIEVLDIEVHLKPIFDDIQINHHFARNFKKILHYNRGILLVYVVLAKCL